MDGTIGDRWIVEDATRGIEDCPGYSQVILEWTDAACRFEGVYDRACAMLDRCFEPETVFSAKPSVAAVRRKADPRMSFYLSLAMPR
jgi:hypothetical protein